MFLFLPLWISDIGTIVTILGFAFTIWQIYKIQDTTSKIEEEVKSTQSKIQKVLAISDLSKSSETIKIIYSYLKEGNYEMAHAKIMEINDIIIEIKEVPALKNLNHINRLEDYGKFLANDLKKLQDSIIIRQGPVDKDTLVAISNDLREISDLFAKINAQLKHNNDD